MSDFLCYSTYYTRYSNESIRFHGAVKVNTAEVTSCWGSGGRPTGGMNRGGPDRDAATNRQLEHPSPPTPNSPKNAAEIDGGATISTVATRLDHASTADKVRFARKLETNDYYETLSANDIEPRTRFQTESEEDFRNSEIIDVPEKGQKAWGLSQIREEEDERRASPYEHEVEYEPYLRARRQSLTADAPRRGSARRGGVSDLEAFLRRRETIDGGVLQQVMEYLKSKGGSGLDDVGDLLGAISTGPSSASTLLSSMEVETNRDDPHSFSRCDYVYVERVDLTWSVDFDRQVLHGDAYLQVRRRRPGSTTLSLDAHMLDIEAVKVNGRGADYFLYPHRGDMGARLDVELPDSRTDGYDVHVKYETGQEAPGLRWLRGGGDQGRPFVFTQCDSVQCRSLLPIQDTPSNKVRYTARVTAPTGMKVLMSALRQRRFVLRPDGRSTHHFRQDSPVAPHLLALAVGDLATARLSERTSLWAEPELIDRAKRELACTEDLLCVAETICGRYTWGKHDVLVLPDGDYDRSATQNPSLTFINPSLVSGDGSTPMHLAHEIAHSWVGNLVTHLNYEHLWLSEGFAHYIGRKILGKKYGHEARLFAASRGLKDLQMVVDIYGPTHPLTCLVADLSRRMPRDTIYIVPYEKGHTLLYYLELQVGGPYEMDQYIKEYIASFKGHSINSCVFQAHFVQYFSRRCNLKKIDWNSWFHSPGMPPFVPDYHTSLEEACGSLTDMWQQWKEDEKCTFKETDLSLLNPMQVLEFLAQMLEAPPLPVSKLEVMDSLYHLDESSNRDVRLKWYLLCLRSHWRRKVEAAVEFAREDGRQFVVLAIFHELSEWDEIKEEAGRSLNRIKTSVSFRTADLLSSLLRVDQLDDIGAWTTRRKSTTPPPSTSYNADDQRIGVGRRRVVSDDPTDGGGRRSSTASTDDRAGASGRRRSSTSPPSADPRTDDHGPPGGRRRSNTPAFLLEDQPVLSIRRKSVFHSSGTPSTSQSGTASLVSSPPTPERRRSTPPPVNARRLSPPVVDQKTPGQPPVGQRRQSPPPLAGPTPKGA